MTPHAAPPPALLHNSDASSAPRNGEIGVLPINALAPAEIAVGLRIVVHCPACGNYAEIEGDGDTYRNVTKMIGPTFMCSTCTWRPTCDADTPRTWRLYYTGRLGGTLLWAVNETHIATLIQYLETSPKRRSTVEFDWEFRHLIQRLPPVVVSGRSRNDVVSLLKKLALTRPRR